VTVLGRELLEQIGARLLKRLGHELAHLVLHRRVAIAPEVPRHELADLVGVGVEGLGHRSGVLAQVALELLLHVLGHRPRLLGERALDLARELLELAADEVDLRAGRLAVEHARADLERVGNRLLAGDPELEPALDELGERTVLDA
jgi:hypothetical protein